MKEGTTSNICPTCGHLIPESSGLSVDLTTNVVMAGGLALHVGPIQASILHVLASRSPRWVSYETLYGQVYGSQARSPQSLRVTISRLAAYLGQMGWKLQAWRNKGYRIVRIDG
jgi:DNA-binding response OmpR family regulator